MSELFARSRTTGRWYEIGEAASDWLHECPGGLEGHVDADGDDCGYWDAPDDDECRWWCEFAALLEEHEESGRPWTWEGDASSAKDEMQAGRVPVYDDGPRLSRYANHPWPDEDVDGDADPIVRCLYGWE